MYRLLRKLDRNVFKTKLNQFETVDISDLIKAVDSRAVMAKQTKHKDEFLSGDIAWIRVNQPDILIRFGFRILKGEILQSAKYGVWSLHHGDSAVNRGGPPAFWEVVNRDPITGVTLQVLSEKLDAGLVLGKSFCKTDFTSFNRNQQSVYAAGVELFCSRLKDFASLGSDIFFSNHPKTDPNQIAKTLYRDPGNVKAFLIAIAFWWRRLSEFLVGIFFTEQWFIFYHHNINFPFYFQSATPLIPPAHTDWADPFLFNHKGKDYIFFESLNKRIGKGRIMCLPMDRLSDNPVNVLEEDYHLSYPTIIEHDDKLYLITESASAKFVCFYECLEFPQKWKKLKPILTDIELYDPTIHKRDGKWYLFGTQRPVAGASADMYLHIYYSNDLVNGEWLPHSMNPVTRDVRGSRPAGKIFSFHGKLVRPAQIGTPKYGYGIRFQQIMKLSPFEFEEARIDDILPWMPNMLATHTYTATNDCFVTDAQLRRFRFF